MQRGLQDLALLISRTAIGLVLVAHGWQKFNDYGVDGVAKNFTGKVPLPELAAYYATYVELVGGALLIVGVATPLIALLVCGDMLGAFLTMHFGTTVFVSDGGFELVWMIGAVALLLLVFGAGRLSVDGLVRSLLPSRNREYA